MCGSKKKNHQCGIGVCFKFGYSHDEKGEQIVNEKEAKRQKFKEAAEKLKDVFVEKRMCKKCGRPIQGHPQPRGKNCILIPLPNIEDIQRKKKNLQLAKDRERKKSEEAKAKDRERKTSEVAKAKARKRNKSEDAKVKARERNKSEDAKVKARERNKSQEAKAKSKARSAAAKKRLKNSKSFIGWTNYEDFSVAKNNISKGLLH